MFARAVRPHRRRLGPLRPAVRRLRPGPGPHRGRVDQGDHRQGRRQRRPRLPHPRDPDQGAALRAGQAPPVGAVDRLLQAPALREVPRSCTPWSTRPPSWPAPPAPRASSTPARPTSCSPRSTRSPRSSGRPRRPERAQASGLDEREPRARRPATTVTGSATGYTTRGPAPTSLQRRDPSPRRTATMSYDRATDRTSERSPRTARTSSCACPPTAPTSRCCAPPPPASPPGSTSPSTTSRTCGSPSARPARWCCPRPTPGARPACAASTCARASSPSRSAVDAPHGAAEPDYDSFAWQVLTTLATSAAADAERRALHGHASPWSPGHPEAGL